MKSFKKQNRNFLEKKFSSLKEINKLLLSENKTTVY